MSTVTRRSTGRSGFSLIVGAALVLACSGRPVPLVARAGTTIGLAIGPETQIGGADAGLAFGTNVVSDRQRGFLVFELRQGSTVVATLPTRFVTRVVPDPASEAGLTGLVPANNGVPLAMPLAQALAMVDIPRTVPTGTYRIYVARSSAPSGSPISGPNPADSPLYEIEILGPQSNDRFTPFDHDEFLEVFAATPEQLQSITPKPKLLLNLPNGQTGLPAAATLEIQFDGTRVDVRGAVMNVPARSGALLTTSLVASNRARVHYVNPLADGQQLALVFEVLDRGAAYDPVSETTHFTVVSQDYYDALGVPMAVGSFNPKGGIR